MSAPSLRRLPRWSRVETRARCWRCRVSVQIEFANSGDLHLFPRFRLATIPSPSGNGAHTLCEREMSSSATGHSFHFFKKTIPLGLSAAHEGITQNMLCTCLRVLPCVCVRARLGNCHANRDHPATIATFFCYLFFARKKKSNLI